MALGVHTIPLVNRFHFCFLWFFFHFSRRRQKSSSFFCDAFHEVIFHVQYFIDDFEIYFSVSTSHIGNCFPLNFMCLIIKSRTKCSDWVRFIRVNVVVLVSNRKLTFDNTCHAESIESKVALPRARVRLCVCVTKAFIFAERSSFIFVYFAEAQADCKQWKLHVQAFVCCVLFFIHFKWINLLYQSVQMAIDVGCEKRSSLARYLHTARGI